MKKFKKLSIIIPCYNEEKTISRIVEKIKKAKVYGLKKEIVVVNDGSTDSSHKVLSYLKIKNQKLKILRHKKNRGKGISIKTGYKAATGDIIIIQDSDLEYDPDEYENLLKPIIEGDADVVYGSRFQSNHPHRVLYFWHSVGNNFLTLLSNALTNLNLTDMETGYKVFTREVAEKVIPKIESSRFGFEPEVTARVAKLTNNNGVRIYEVGISYHGRTYKEGKKINWKDGLLAIWYLIRFNLFN